MITIEFAQEGQALRLTSDSVPVQFSDGLPVQIVVDANYVSATELYLMTRPNKGAPSRTVLTLSNRTAAGKISRTALMQSGLVDFVLSGKIGDTILPTASCRVYVLPSVDPQSAQLAQDPETVTSIVDASVAKYLTGATEKISNDYWSGYKYPDGRAVLKWTLDVQNKDLISSNGVYVTNKLFDSTYRKYPDIFVEKPEFRATYVPSPNRVHVSAYATFQRGNSETSSGSGDKYFYKNPPDVYIVCGDNVNTTLLGELYMVAEGRWK